MQIYLYLKTNNNDFVKHVQNVLVKALFIVFSLHKFSKFLLSFLKAQVSFPSNFASIFSAIKHNTSVLFFSSNIIYFGQWKQLKRKFLGFTSAQVEVRQIPHVNFKMAIQFFFKFWIIFCCHDTQILFKF